MNQKSFERIRGNRVIGGVCSGLGQYFNLDPIIFRFIFIALLLAGGSSILIYLILWIIIPNEPYLILHKNDQENGQPKQELIDISQTSQQPQDSTNLLFGLILITGGVMLLLHNFVPYFRMEKLWPAILMIVGIGLIFQKNTKQNESL
jgi:phage shock protein C